MKSFIPNKIIRKTTENKKQLIIVYNDYEYSTAAISFVCSDELDKLIENDADELVSVFIPATIAIGSLGVVSTATITYYRIIVNAKTGIVYAVNGIAMGEFNDTNNRPKSIRQLSECK